MFKVKIIYFDGNDENVVFSGVVDIENDMKARRNCISYALDNNRECKEFIVASVTGKLIIVQTIMEDSNVTYYNHVDQFGKTLETYGIKLEIDKLTSSRGGEFHEFSREEEYGETNLNVTEDENLSESDTNDTPV